MLFLVVVGSLVLFVVSEKTPLHFSRTARRAFWYLLSCALFLWLVRWMQSLETLGHLWIMITAVRVARLDSSDAFDACVCLCLLVSHVSARIRVARCRWWQPRSSKTRTGKRRG